MKENAKILIDTCTLIWWTLDPEHLSKKASETIKLYEDKEIQISSFSIWEIAIKVKNKKLDIGISIEEFSKLLSKTNSVNIIPLDEKVLIKSVNLDWEHKDPVDRVNVSLALMQNIPIVTKDLKIREFYQNSIW